MKTLPAFILFFLSFAGAFAQAAPGVFTNVDQMPEFPGGFSYAGDSTADLQVFASAQTIVLAGAAPGLARKARALGRPDRPVLRRPGVQGRLSALPPNGRRRRPEGRRRRVLREGAGAGAQVAQGVTVLAVGAV